MFAPFENKTLALLEQALDLRSERHRLISSNIANQDTPGYKGLEIDFKSALKQAFGSADGISLAQTDPRHLPTGQPAGPSAVPQPISAPGGSSRLDGNTVNSEKEMAKLAENTLMYDATAQIVALNFKSILSAIQEGR